jgi:tetratricopeptide (TPR) repeat protein
MFRCVLANLYAELERRDDARAELEEVAAHGFSALPRDNAWLFAMSWLPEVLEFLGDTTRAEELHELLLPFGHLNAYSPPELCTGSVARYLGILAATAGRFDQAEGHFEEALDAHARMRARAWLVHTQHDYARTLLRRDGEGDRAKADRLLADAFTSACELGMTVLAGKISALRERTEPVARAAATGVFQLEGDFWSLAYEGKAFRLRDAKGLRYIHRLLREPGREFHVAELVSAPDTGDAGPVIDARAKAEYGRRIEDLRDEVEEATAWGDQDRVARAQEEIDAIAAALAAAYGLGGRERRGADSSERLRKAVTNRIRVSLARIGDQNPELSRHLSNSIVTGTFCSYGPDREVLWRL